MLFGEIKPFVRYSQELVLGAGWKQGWVRAYDHRLIYVVSGTGEVSAGGMNRRMLPGDLMYWPAGTGYRISHGEDEVTGIICINFDFGQQHANVVHNMPPVSENEYDDGKISEKAEFEDEPLLNGVIMLEGQTEIGAVLKEMDREARRPDAYTPLLLSALLTKALCMLVRQAEDAKIRKSPSGEVIDYVHAHFTQQLTNAELARKFGYHTNYISQLVREQTGLALHKYLLKVRIDEALRLINSTDMPIAEIAAAVGFKSTSYFSQYFKKMTGYQPSAFRVNGM